MLQDPGALWVPPSEVDLDSYGSVLAPPSSGGQGFLMFMANSAIVALGTVALTLLVALPGAYAVSRLRFFGRRQVSVLFLAVYLFPAILLAVPLFVFFTRIGLRGSLVGLLIVYVSQIVAVSIYMLRNYFDTVPVSLEEAAAIDGCSRLGVMWRISLPLAMPAIIANALFIFMIAWNEFLFALLFLVEERDALDGVARPVAAGRQHRGPDHRADGGLGHRHAADHRRCSSPASDCSPKGSPPAPRRAEGGFR